MVLIIDRSHACYLVGIDNDEHFDGTIPKKICNFCCNGANDNLLEVTTVNENNLNTLM